MSNINPKLQYLFFRNDKWPTQPLAPWQAYSGKFGEAIPVRVMPNGDVSPAMLQQHGWHPALASHPGDLYCVGYDTISTINGIASITVVPVGSQTRAMCKEVVKGKHAAGKTFEVVFVPHRLKESIILGAKYFLLTRERP